MTCELYLSKAVVTNIKTEDAEGPHQSRSSPEEVLTRMVAMEMETGYAQGRVGQGDNVNRRTIEAEAELLLLKTKCKLT